MEHVKKIIVSICLDNKEIEVVGLRPGEKLNETLISEKELGHAFITNISCLFSNSYVIIK